MTNQSRAEQLEEKRRFWKQQIEHWKESGLTQIEFCRLRNLKNHQLTYWKKRFHSKQEQVSLVELKWNPALQTTLNPSGSPLRLILNDQYRIDIDRGFDSLTLQQVVLSLRQL